MTASPLTALEPRLRQLLPAQLYAAAWVNPSTDKMTAVFNHLRTLQHTLYDYVPRHVSEEPPALGDVHYHWKSGSLMFTDLAGFTRILETNVPRGYDGASSLLQLLNSYFASMIEIIGHSGGSLLEFTGDALLAVFPADENHQDTVRAVRAGLRMQRAMQQFATIEYSGQPFSLKMRIGIHAGPYLAADVGTPRRMEHVLLGKAVHQAKLTESAGRVDRVNLSQFAYENVREQFHFEPGEDGYQLVLDDFGQDELGEYELVRPRRRRATPLLLDRSPDGLTQAIEESLDLVEPLASYLPPPIVNLLVESTAKRRIKPDCSDTVVFVSLLGLPEAVNHVPPEEIDSIVHRFSAVFAHINGAVEARGGLLKKVTYHLAGSDIVIYFGAPNAHSDDARRAARAALDIRKIIAAVRSPALIKRQISVYSQIGINFGPTFAGEIGEPRGRREYNVLGDTVNTAARLMNKAGTNEIYLSGAVFDNLGEEFTTEFLGDVPLKGKEKVTSIYRLDG